MLVIKVATHTALSSTHLDITVVPFLLAGDPLKQCHSHSAHIMLSMDMLSYEQDIRKNMYCFILRGFHDNYSGAAKA